MSTYEWLYLLMWPALFMGGLYWAVERIGDFMREYEYNQHQRSKQ